MTEHNTSSHPGTPLMYVKRIVRIVWLTIVYFFDVLADAIIERFSVMQTQSDLFLGSVLTLIGFFSFQSGKYCDGNTADYLSCTRPTTYYYYPTISIILIVIGICLVLVWKVRRDTEAHR